MTTSPPSSPPSAKGGRSSSTSASSCASSCRPTSARCSRCSSESCWRVSSGSTTPARRSRCRSSPPRSSGSICSPTPHRHSRWVSNRRPTASCDARREGPPIGSSTTEMWLGIAWVGLVMAVVTLAALDLGSHRGRPRRIGRHRRRPHDGVHDARPRPALQHVQRPLGSRQRVPQPVHEPGVVGRHRPVARAPGRSRAGAVPQRRVRHDPAREPTTG